MADRHLDIQVGFCPYQDGSGHRVSICIRKQTAADEPEIYIESGGRISVEQWREVTNGVARLLSSMPESRP